jgi:hypothetical protein
LCQDGLNAPQTRRHIGAGALDGSQQFVQPSPVVLRLSIPKDVHQGVTDVLQRLHWFLLLFFKAGGGDEILFEIYQFKSENSLDMIGA